MRNWDESVAVEERLREETGEEFRLEVVREREDMVKVWCESEKVKESVWKKKDE